MKLIDADKIFYFHTNIDGKDYIVIHANHISDIATVDARPIKRGHWCFVGPYMYNNDGFIGGCSACGKRIRFYGFPNYCPSCGVKMYGYQARLIDPSRLEHFEVTCSDGENYIFIPVKDIYEIPTVDAEPIRNSRWLANVSHDNILACARCMCEIDTNCMKERNFCPSCGAEMCGGKNETN